MFLDQARDFSYVIRAISVMGLTTLGLLFFYFRHNPYGFYRNSVLLGLACIYTLIIWHGWRWLRRSDASGADARRYFRVACGLLFGLGVLWGVLVILLMQTSPAEERALLYAIAVGSISTSVLVSPPASAIAFWAPMSLGALLSLVLFNPDIYAISDLLAFAGLTGFCILYLNRRMNERAISAIRLEENAELIRLLLRDFEENASDWLWETNAQMEMQPASQRLVQVARRPAESLRGRFPEALLGEEALRDSLPGSALDRLRQAIADRAPFRDLVVPVVLDGEQRYWSLTGKPILDRQGRFSGYHGVGSDITRQRRQQEHISFLARHDSLTRLANRVLFSETLSQFCETAHEAGFALLCMDLDEFKAINDTLGHAMGDALLVTVAERLRSCIRDFDIAARLGGDEFAIIVLTTDIDEALAVAGRIIERVSRPFRFDGQTLQIGISVGIAMAPVDGSTPTQLLKNADLALYRAKGDGRGTVRVYDPAMDETMRVRHVLQTSLHQALARGEISVVYQPIVNLVDQRIAGAEALLRWTHPERGNIPPAQFIPLAEAGGIMEEIGEFVLREACREAAAWPPELTVAVNLSPLQSGEARIVPLIAGILKSSGLPASRLELEVVENTMLESGSPTEETLRQLHRLGVRIALDDFGTGYSSLSYLRRFPFGKLKIDSSFIRDLGEEDRDDSIVLTIIRLAEQMNMLVTAEGVETAAQAELLRSYGCAQAQGFLFYQPMSGQDFARLVASRETASPRRMPDGV